MQDLHWMMSSDCAFHYNLYGKGHISIKCLNEVAPVMFTFLNLFSTSHTSHVSLHESLVVFSTSPPPIWIKAVLDDPQLTRLNNYELC
jgi:hypothetical protein